MAMLAIVTPTFADTSANIIVDWRGLPQVQGVLRENSKSEWGFVNFVAFGPNWAYTAQDYAAKEHKKSTIQDPELGNGLLFTGKIWAGSSGLDIREEFYDVSSDDEAKVHVRWTISSQKNQSMNLERAYLRFPLPINAFSGGKAGSITLPAEYEKEWIGFDGNRRLTVVSADETIKLKLDVKSGNPIVQDARKDKQERYELRLEFPNAKSANSSTIEFTVAGTFADSLKRGKGKVNLQLPPPPAKLTAGKDWCEFSFSNDITSGSILDFSNVSQREAPAGQFGFAKVSKEGHIVFENRPDRPIRFVGGNLCFTANFLSKEECKRVVQDFVRRGWNTVRFHHIDVTITKDEWNKLWERTTYPEISPARLDQLDYLMAEFKKAGIYVTFDLYAMGGLGSCEGFDKPLNSNTIKAVVPIHKPAEDQWFRRAMEIFDHVNPYTGIKWKDDPTVLFVTLINEDSIASVWWGAADLYVEKYNEWAKTKGYPEYPKKDIGKKKEFAEFLYTVKAEANRRMSQRLKDAGVKTLISGGNWWDNAAQAYEREALELVDNHGYGDHPQPSYQKLPFHVNQTSSVRSGNPTYNEPMMKAPSRILGRPFAVTEYNFCPPNRFRAEGGLAMGAYSSLQDWDAIYRFAWSHAREALFGDHFVSGFDIVRDPVGQMTERQIVLLFGRGDVAPAKNVYGYGVTAGEAFGNGLGDMWGRGLFPHPFTQLGYVSRIGSWVADNGRAPAIDCTKTWTVANKQEIPKMKYTGTTSDTGEVFINTKDGDLIVNTPRTAGITSCERRSLKAGPLSISDVTEYCSVSASAMDERNLTASRRILVLHITNVLNTDMTFTNAKMTDTTKWGKLPYLAKCGSVKIELQNENPNLRLYALASDGSRLRQVPATYANGTYTFIAQVAPGEGKDAPTMMYELSDK